MLAWIQAHPGLTGLALMAMSAAIGVLLAHLCIRAGERADAKHRAELQRIRGW